MGRHEESGKWGRVGKSEGKKGFDKDQGLEIWNAFLADAREIASTDDYDKWIRNLRFVAEVDKSVLIAARDRLTYDRISANHRPMLKRVWRKVDPKGRALEIACWKDIPVATRELAGNPWAVEQDIAASEDAKAADTSAPAATSPQTDNSMTFDTLIVGDTNKRAVRLAEQLLEGSMLRAEVAL
ncbi:MAG: DnaA N-terminal domain-containing protein, partial [Rhodospirillaceae bacterium]